MHSFFRGFSGSSCIHSKKCIDRTICFSVIFVYSSVILKKKTVKIDFFFLEEFCSLPVWIKSDIDSVGYIQHDVVFQCVPLVLQQKEILDSFETTRV